MSDPHSVAPARIIMRDNHAPLIHPLEEKLGLMTRLWDDGFVRKAVILIALAAIWEAYGRILNNPLLFPTFSETMQAVVERIEDGTLPARAWASIKVLLMGYGVGVVMAGSLTILAINTRLGSDFLETMTGMFSPPSHCCRWL
jgi:NitT/TauT family transport system permease protein